MTMVANTDNVILLRVIDPKSGRLSLSAAEGLLSIKFADEDINRMNELAGLAQEGELTAEQSEEIDSYNRIGHFVALIHTPRPGSR